jgi:gas vesicle protein
MSRRRQPEIRYESSGTSFFALLGAIGAGAALMYFFDPETGRRRRALVRDKYAQGRTVLRDKTESAVHSAADQTRGAIARIQSRIASRSEGAVDLNVSNPGQPTEM